MMDIFFAFAFLTARFSAAMRSSSSCFMRSSSSILALSSLYSARFVSSASVFSKSNSGPASFPQAKHVSSLSALSSPHVHLHHPPAFCGQKGPTAPLSLRYSCSSSSLCRYSLIYAGCGNVISSPLDTSTSPSSRTAFFTFTSAVSNSASHFNATPTFCPKTPFLRAFALYWKFSILATSLPPFLRIISAKSVVTGVLLKERNIHLRYFVSVTKSFKSAALSVITGSPPVITPIEVSPQNSYPFAQTLLFMFFLRFLFSVQN